MELNIAFELAKFWADAIHPACDRVEIVGSIRRRMYKVNDIDLLALPKFTITKDLFGAPCGEESLLDSLLPDLIKRYDARPAKNGPRQKTIALAEGVNLEIYIVIPPADWGVLQAIRTGPKEFSKWIVTPRQAGGALPAGYKVADGVLRRGSRVIPMPEEEKFMNFLGLGHVHPQHRKPGLAYK